MPRPKPLPVVEIRIRKMDDGNVVVDVKECKPGSPSSIETLYASRVKIDIEKGFADPLNLASQVSVWQDG